MLSGNDIFKAGQGREQTDILKGSGHAQGRHLVGGKGFDLQVTQPQASGGGRRDAAQNIDEGGFAGAIGTDQAVHAPVSRHRKTHPPERTALRNGG